MRDTRYEVRLYDYDAPGRPLIRRGVTYACASIRYTVNLYSPGSFELVIDADAPYADAFVKGRWVQIGRVFWGIIGAVFHAEDSASDTATATGSDLLGLLREHITVPPWFEGVQGVQGFDVASGDTESVIKHFVDGNAISPAAVYRAIPGLVLAPNQHRGRADDRYMTRHDKLTDVLGILAKDAGLGLRIDVDIGTGALVFDVYAGTDRTIGQRDVPPVVISTDRGTALSMTYENSDAGYKNAFYATLSGAEYEDEALTMVYYRDDTPTAGFDRREVHMDISAETPTAGEEYAELKRLALIKAADHETVLRFTAAINPARVNIGSDVLLGDRVTVIKRKWGVQADVPLVGATFEYTGAGDNVQAVFGEEKISIIRAIMRGR